MPRQALERICWHACAFGLSYKADKVQLARGFAKMLGEYVGRGRRMKDPEKVKAIKEFPYPEELKHLQQFLGVFNYVRPSCRPTAAKHLHYLKPYLKKDATWPMEPAARKAIDALKALAVEQIVMMCLDEEAAILAFHPDEKTRLSKGPIRPAEQYADSCGFAIGAGCVQMNKEQTALNLLACYSSGLSITQMQAHPFETIELRN